MGALMRYAGLFAALSLSLVALAACENAPPYEQPAMLTPDNAATVMGSKVAHSLLVADEYSNVIGVDGMRNLDIEKPLLVTPGSHTIDIAYRRARMNGHIATAVSLEAGKIYVAYCTMNGHFFASCWIADEHQAALTDKLVVKLGDGTLIPFLVHGGE